MWERLNAKLESADSSHRSSRVEGLAVSPCSRPALPVVSVERKKIVSKNLVVVTGAAAHSPAGSDVRLNSPMRDSPINDGYYDQKDLSEAYNEVTHVDSAETSHTLRAAAPQHQTDCIFVDGAVYYMF
jgi:hypothetical protein